MATSSDVDAYIEKFTEPTKTRLVRVRELAHAAIPNAQERIAYGVPTLCDEKGKYIAYFAGYKEFVSVYPVHLAEKVEGVEKHLHGKSTARFANDEPLPEKIISQLMTNLQLAYIARTS